MELIVFLPRPDTSAASTIAAGAGVVGTPEGQRVLVDYEGARYSFQSSGRYADRVLHAADRHVQHYPTIARGLFPADELERIGSYDDQLGVVTLDGPEAEADLARWLGRAVEETDLLTSAVLHERRRRGH